MSQEESEITIQEWYVQIVDDDFRNDQIANDLLKCYQDGRNCVLLTQRTAHVVWFAEKMEQEAAQVVALTGSLGAKKTRDALKRLAEIPTDQNFILVATGSFIGEGFDEPRLDTLFLAMPISWKGTLQQYAGRLHRLSEHKKEVVIYDYVDVHVRMLEKMYQKRLKGYASMGYKVKGEHFSSTPLEIIFDQDNFLPVFSLDIAEAVKEVLIVSPFVRKWRTLQMIKYLCKGLDKGAHVTVVTRPATDFKVQDQGTLQSTLSLLKEAGISVVFKSGIHQKFAIVDHKLVWYGSINLLSYGVSQESIMRITNTNIANDLRKSIEKCKSVADST